VIRRTLAAALVLTAVGTSPAGACDPYSNECWGWSEEPLHEVESWSGEPTAPPVVPQGLYLVTDVYAADVVSVDGSLTIYSTATVSETPGTYARVLDTVGTGAASPYDGSAFNGRAARDDGLSVAGTYYETFVQSGGTFVPVSIVFFQDDSALAQLPRPAPAATPTPITRLDQRLELPPRSVTEPGQAPTTAPRVPLIRVGVATSPVGEVRSEIEVLRGRAVHLWMRTAVDGVVRPVAGWRILSGEHVALGASTGDGDEAFTARWDVVTPPGTAWILGVETMTVIGGVPHVSVGEIVIVVRSPALIR